jgi:DNA-binding winged helix-turn-helix (wHTH) protein
MEAIELRNEMMEILEANERHEDENPDFSMFRDTTRRLLVNMWDASNRMLSHEDIKDYVLQNDERSDAAVRDVVREARDEIKTCRGFHYEIKNEWGKGYRLVKQEVWENVGKTRRTLQKQR